MTRSGQFADLEVSRRVAEDALLKRLANSALKSKASSGNFFIGHPFDPSANVIFNDDILPAKFWSYLSDCDWNNSSKDWVSGDFSFNYESGETFEASGMAFNVKLDANELPGMVDHSQGDKAAPDQLTDGAAGQINARGRPAKWDWEGAIAHIVAIANQPDGLEGLANREIRQADIEKAISGWFHERFDAAPVTSEVRKRASLIMAALAEAEKARADN